MRPGQAGFTIFVDRTLREEGLAGATAQVWLDGETIRIAGQGGTGLAIPLETIERLRVGVEPGRRPGYQALLWRRGPRAPLRLRLFPPQQGYADAMRAIAAALALRRGTGAVELGTTGRAALFNAVFFLLLLGAYLLLAARSYRNGLWPVALAFIVLSLLMAALVVEIARKQRPRPLQSLEELEQVLPILPPNSI